MKIKLKYKRINCDEFKIYNEPKLVYIPLISGGDTNITVLVTNGEYVYKGSMIAKRKGDNRIPIFSSVSGTVVDFVEKNCNGKKIKCVAIENDFKEKIKNKYTDTKNLGSYSFEDFLNCIRDNGIIGLGSEGEPTYIKYQNKNNKVLIVNATECEPLIKCDTYLMSIKCEEILETIDALIEINKLDYAVIAISSTNINVKKILDNFIGTYLKIKIVLVNDYYPVGYTKNLVKETINVKYNKKPCEQGIIINNVATIYAIYEALKYNKPLIERVVTFTGDSITPVNVLIKNGTLLQDVIDELGTSGGKFILGGPMRGKVALDDTVISLENNCVLNIKEELKIATECLNCGKCSEVCPVKITPTLEIKKSVQSKCIKCGLCTQVCPANIDNRKRVGEF